MKTLTHWNKEREEYWRLVRLKVTNPERVPNGIECPACGGHLHDTIFSLPTTPVQIKVKCQECPFVGYRLE